MNNWYILIKILDLFIVKYKMCNIFHVITYKNTNVNMYNN